MATLYERIEDTIGPAVFSTINDTAGTKYKSILTLGIKVFKIL